MNDDGYTLAEMLVALILASLLIGSVGAASRVLARGEARLAESRARLGDLRRADNQVATLLARAELFAAGGGAARGDEREFAFACDEGRPCQLRIERSDRETRLHLRTGAREASRRLRGVAEPRFRYLSISGEAREGWSAGDGEPLAALVLLDGERPAAVYRLPAQQAVNCTFDVRTGGCADAGGQRP